MAARRHVHGGRPRGRLVPLARRQLLHEPLKLALALAGVTLAVALVGLLFGLREGIRHQVTTFVDNAGADVYVAPRDSRSFVRAGRRRYRCPWRDSSSVSPGLSRRARSFPRSEVMRRLREIAKARGQSVLIVSHDDRIREFVDRVLWLEDGEFKSERALVRDPVCGMEIDPQRAAAHATVDGSDYWFCAQGCRDEFLARHAAATQTRSAREPHDNQPAQQGIRSRP